ncbi:hypothetical protein [Streptomyces africanus]|uniref:hypothetical protein n=1 Tax=Streptomyces africanus TaxID=231024 RepID=UPI000A377B95|nr:hypothetical protein [Streptomyces africanus]
MADPAELVTLELTFWYKGKVPGDRVQVRRDEVRSWYGFAKLVDDVEPAKADETADTGAQKTPEPADTSPAAKTTTPASKTKQA